MSGNIAKHQGTMSLLQEEKVFGLKPSYDTDMEPFSTCVIRIDSKGTYAGKVNYCEVLSELDRAIDTRSYEILCLGEDSSFMIADPDNGFFTYIQFNFPSPISAFEDIGDMIRLLAGGNCCMDTLRQTEHYRLLLVDECQISFK
ncbi:hypothetical protein [Flavobacterium sp.]|uniref:hypothetical protein n=1 Tax=Flavobacterium sp. TaxID=239 RepID=UPI004033DDA5